MEAKLLPPSVASGSNLKVVYYADSRNAAEVLIEGENGGTNALGAAAITTSVSGRQV